MLLQQQTETYFDNSNVRVMAKTRFEPGRNSRLLGINLPRMEIRDDRLPVLLFKSLKDPFRIQKGENSEISSAGSRKVEPRYSNCRRGNFRQFSPVSKLANVSKSRRIRD